MEPKPSRFKRYVAIALIALAMPFLLLGTAIAATGTVTVKVAEAGPDGTRLYIPVPALLFDAALFVVPWVIPDEALEDARREIAPYRDSLRSFAHEIESIPSGVLVEVKDGDEEVRITKSWRTFDIEVDSDDTDIRISMPARLLSRSLDIL